MASRVEWSGLDELRADLRALPDELAAEASGIVVGAATAAEAEIVASYPEHSGNLKAGVDVIQLAAGRYGAGAAVRNRAKHAFIFENGTQARHTDIGANRGAMPPGHVFIPAVIRHRRVMYERLKAILKRQGLTVSGDA